MARAPRQPFRAWRCWARGAVFASVCLANGAGAQEIASAFYKGPTSRYPHAVLGDGIEYTTLVVRLSNGVESAATWPRGMVFEDIAPRVADLDGDGAPEVIVIESSDTQGARLAVWGLRNGQLRQLAHTPHIGARFRWLAPVAWQDLDGDGRAELAYIDRPHLAKTLRVWRYETQGTDEARLIEVASLKNLTNHRIGWDYIAGGARDCGQGPRMVLADGTWSRVMSVTFTGTSLVASDLGPYSPGALTAALSC